jgi:hypothetical protein
MIMRCLRYTGPKAEGEYSILGQLDIDLSDFVDASSMTLQGQFALWLPHLIRTAILEHYPSDIRQQFVQGDQDMLILGETSQNVERLIVCFVIRLLGHSIEDIWLHEYFFMRESGDFRNDIYAMRDLHAHSVPCSLPSTTIKHHLMTHEEDDFGRGNTDASYEHSPTAMASMNKSTFQHKHHTKSASTSIRRRIPQADMPKLTNLDQLTLHSASSQLVGTPFATDSTKYEYPFPEDASAYSPSASSSTTPAILTPPLSSGSTFPFISASASSAQLTLPCLIQPGDSLSSSSSSSSSSSTYSFAPVHPRFKPPTNSPVPPSLVKKRPRWSLSIMGRRRSSYEGGNFPEDGSMNLIENFLRSDLGDGIMVPHSQRDELSRSEH